MSTVILVVEDEALVADDLQRTLGRLGYEVPITVSTGQEAIDAARDFRPQLVLMDIRLKGGIDGIEASRQIRGLNIPVVFLTSHSDEATLARAKETSPQGYLLKPFHDRELRATIEMALHHHALEAENARLYQVAQRAIQARDEVLQIVAHDLRNPLNSLLLLATGLRRRRAQTERRDQEPIEGIRASVMRMNRLINDLLDVARLDEGEPLSIRKGHVSVEALVTRAVHEQSPAAAAASIELRGDVSPSLPEIWTDSFRLGQALENLIANALKFTRPGGCVTVGAFPRDGSLIFSVADNGKGITPDEVPHVYDRFWQADKSDRRGAGLGLAIVKGIIESLGGCVSVESRLEHGTTFTFSLPIVTASEAGPGIVRVANARPILPGRVEQEGPWNFAAKGS